MKKATINNPNSDEKVVASDFSIEIQPKNGDVVKLEIVQYTYDDVFEYIKEQFEENMESIQKLVIEVKR